VKKFKTLFFILCFSLVAGPALCDGLFDRRYPVRDGLNVFELSDTFADIFEKLDSVKWGGKDIRVAIEALESLDKSVHIAVTNNRVVVVQDGNIVGNWPHPADRDWRAFGEITTAIVLRLREQVPELRALSEGGLYEVVVGALMRGIDENGRYVHSRRNAIADNGRLLTSAGIEGQQDNRGNFRVTGVFKGGLADSAGIRPGDLIMEIDGVPVPAMRPGEVSAAFAGFNSGTLKVLVANESGSRPLVLRRATVIMADADIIWREKVADGRDLPAGILEIVVHQVSDGAAAIIHEALNIYSASGIILDLRASFGDDERAVAKIAGLFLGRVPVLRSVETAMDEIEIIPGGDAVINNNIPIVVVVSGGTRGTAEALAAAIYENGRGALIGTPTAGRARLATRLDLRNGGMLEVNNRIVKTGSGRAIDGRGIFPIVCLSNIRNTEQREAFFINVVNGDFGARDFNREDVDPDAVRRGCPAIRSGADEDSVAAAISARILTDSRIYHMLINK